MLDKLNVYILIVLVILSIFFDLTQKRIPNKITFPVIIWALLSHPISSGLSGVVFTVLGFVVGFLIYLIPFMLGGMGAGDVKLMAAIGALMGWQFILKTAVVAGLVGGVLVIFYLIYKRELLSTLKKLLGMIMRPIFYFLMMNFQSKFISKAYEYFLKEDKIKEKYYIPYGVAIGIGAILVYFI